MALNDWRHRRDNDNDTPLSVSGIIMTLAVIVALLVALVSAFQGWNNGLRPKPHPDLN